jgi:hypothetical protein
MSRLPAPMRPRTGAIKTKDLEWVEGAPARRTQLGGDATGNDRPSAWICWPLEP